jgi:hypothetical protein
MKSERLCFSIAVGVQAISPSPMKTAAVTRPSTSGAKYISPLHSVSRIALKNQIVDCSKRAGEIRFSLSDLPRLL